jgi:transposase-like protein
MASVAGRPTKLTEERESDLVLLLAAGVPIGVAARSVGVSERSVERWMKDGLRERVAEARAAGQDRTDRPPRRGSSF